MKLFIILLSMITLISMTLFNFHTFSQVYRIVSELGKINEILDSGGRQRYRAQKHYADMALQTSDRDDLLKTFLSGNVFFKHNYELALPEVNSMIIQNRNRRDELHQSLRNIKSNYPLTLNESVYPKDIEKLRIWSEEIVNILDQIQDKNISLAKNLSGSLVKKLQEIVIINAVSLISLFIIILGVYSYTTLTLTRNLKNTNKELELKNNEMEQFIYTVSHDLKAPLVTIGGFSRILSKELVNNLSEKQQYYLERIQDNINLMEVHLGDLLSLSTIIRQDIDKTYIDVKGIISQQCGLLESQITHSNATFEIREPLLPVYANQRLLEQCLLNLLTNAIRYRDPGRPLVVIISVSKDAIGTTIAVKDNGVGIDKKYHELIFRIFERLSDGEGSGVGLTIVKTMMEKHHGRVTLESEVGVGSNFFLMFPHIK